MIGTWSKPSDVTGAVRYEVKSANNNTNNPYGSTTLTIKQVPRSARAMVMRWSTGRTAVGRSTCLPEDLPQLLRQVGAGVHAPGGVYDRHVRPGPMGDHPHAEGSAPRLQLLDRGGAGG